MSDHTGKHRAPRRKSRLYALLWTLAALASMLLVLRIFYGDVYPVSSASMRPTIFAGSAQSTSRSETEWVLVTYDRSPPERFELVVLHLEDGEEPLVKRVLGLPGEVCRLSGGDLYINGEPLGKIAAGGLLIPLWDSEFQAWSEWLSVESESPSPTNSKGSSTTGIAPQDTWRDESGTLVLDAIRAKGSSPRLRMHHQASDGYLSPEGLREPGRQPVNDLVFETDFVLEELGKDAPPSLLLTLTEGGDAFSLLLTFNPDSAAQTQRFEASFLRGTLAQFEAGKDEPAQGLELLAKTELSMEVDKVQSLRFGNIDNRLFFILNGTQTFEQRYLRNEPLVRPGLSADHVAPRFVMTGSGIHLRFESLRLLRDLFWLPLGAFAVHQELVLGPDEIFVLGDNSRASTDSRSFGPVSIGRISGRVKAVLWPFSRVRGL